jgi:hypothetical protein
MKPTPYSILAMLALTGCVGGVVSNVPDSHPANPQAERSAVAPMKPTLLAGSQLLVLPVSTNDTGMQHEHHQSSPAGPAQKPAEHQHEHPQPKQEEKK